MTGSAILVLAVGSALRGQGPTPAFTPEAGPSVYRPVRRPPITDAPDGRVTVSVLPGTLRDDRLRTASLEATLRLHLWLALRDVHPTGPLLDWAPATAPGHDVELETAARCEAEDLDLARPLGRSDRALLGEPLRRREELRVYLDLGSEATEFGVEVRVCPPGSRGITQVFGGQAGSEGPVLREILAWLSPQLQLDDVEPWFQVWAQPLAPDLGVLRAYGSALIQSMDGTIPDELLAAARLLPEAGWLAAALTPRGASRRALLEQAASLRPGFTAVLEDLAWSWIEADRADLARLALDRLRRTSHRPSGLLIAARGLDAGRPEQALVLLEDLPPRWSGTTAARRLEARARLALGDALDGRAAAAAWALADPSAAEAWLLQGDALALLDEPVGARHAYEQALAHPSRLRPRVLERWASLLLDAPEPATVLELLTSDEDGPIAEANPPLLELRAWAHWLAGNPRDAADDTARLVALAPDAPRHRRNRCVFALAAGVSDSPPEECGTPAFPDVFGTVMEATWLSRRPFRSPDEGGQLDRRLEEAIALAPLDPSATGAAVRVLGPRAKEEEEEALQARFRVAVGAVSP